MSHHHHDDASFCLDDDSSSDHYSQEEGRSVHSSELKLAKRESTAVWGLRWLVFAVLLLSTLLVASLTYFFTKKAENDEFKASFRDNASKILDSLGSSVEQSISGATAFVVNMVGDQNLVKVEVFVTTIQGLTIVHCFFIQHSSFSLQLSHARDSQQTWPNVTIPDFEARAQRFLSLTKTLMFMQFMLITPETRLGWEAYSADHGRGWVEESMEFLKTNDLYQDVYKARNISEPTYLDFIHNYSAWGVENPKGLPYDSKLVTVLRLLSLHFLCFNADGEI